MKSSQQIVISASRRTDIPAFYMSWFMQQIQKRSFEVINPYNRKKAVVPAIPDKVHTIVFWSKNFGPFIEGGHGQTLAAMGYNLFFQFYCQLRRCAAGTVGAAFKKTSRAA